jgi:hypothetical protein
MSRRKPGRTRIKLAKLLTDLLGFSVDPEDIWDNNYPEAKYLDLCRWGAYLKNGRKSVHIASWDRMVDCVKEGITMFATDDFSFEICRKG